MKETLTNIEMERRLVGLSPLLECTGKLGYAAARNARKLQDQLTEFIHMKDKLLEKYGHFEGDGWKISSEDEGFGEFMEEYRPIATLSHEFEPFIIDIDETSQATGKAIFDNWWMFKEEECTA